MKKFTSIVLVCTIAVFVLSCKKSLQTMMDEYITFYYPVTSRSYYEIAFEWGDYVIESSAAVDEEVHPDSEPFRGFMSFRPFVTGTAPEDQLLTYLVTPDGEVWTTTSADIPESSEREEVRIEKDETGTTTMTGTITSGLEPVVTNFLKSRDQWTKYAAIEGNAGNYSLKKAG